MTTYLHSRTDARPLPRYEGHELRPQINHKENSLWLDLYCLTIQQARKLANRIASICGRRMQSALKIEGTKVYLVCTFAPTNRLVQHASTAVKVISEHVESLREQQGAMA